VARGRRGNEHATSQMTVVTFNVGAPSSTLSTSHFIGPASVCLISEFDSRFSSLDCTQSGSV
jgi:hypothetical protein